MGTGAPWVPGRLEDLPPQQEAQEYSTGQKHMRHFSLTVLTLVIMSPAQERIYSSFTD